MIAKFRLLPNLAVAENILIIELLYSGTWLRFNPLPADIFTPAKIHTNSEPAIAMNKYLTDNTMMKSIPVLILQKAVTLLLPNLGMILPPKKEDTALNRIREAVKIPTLETEISNTSLYIDGIYPPQITQTLDNELESTHHTADLLFKTSRNPVKNDSPDFLG